MKKNFMTGIIAIAIILVVTVGLLFYFTQVKSRNSEAPSLAELNNGQSGPSQKKLKLPSETESFKWEDPEKAELKKKIDDLKGENPETVAYIYIPGSQLDEPVVQAKDNEKYLNTTFDGGQQPFMGTVFMDMDNKADFSDRLTWLFGHARGSKVEDHRMFNDVNFYSDTKFMDEHPYCVVQTPNGRIFYEVMFFCIVPETTAFYQTEFEDDVDFKELLTEVSKTASVTSDNFVIDEKSEYLVLSTCREEDVTIRANLYLRRIPDKEIDQLLKDKGDFLEYKPTR